MGTALARAANLASLSLSSPIHHYRTLPLPSDPSRPLLVTPRPPPGSSSCPSHRHTCRTYAPRVHRAPSCPPCSFLPTVPVFSTRTFRPRVLYPTIRPDPVAACSWCKLSRRHIHVVSVPQLPACPISPPRVRACCCRPLCCFVFSPWSHFTSDFSLAYYCALSLPCYPLSNYSTCDFSLCLFTTA